MKKPIFISFSGRAGSGKTTVSEYIKSHFIKNYFTVKNFGFASPLKDALCLWFDWDRNRIDSDFSYKEGSQLDDGSPDPYCQALNMSRREIMQKFGTECMRHGMHKNFWIIMADLSVKLGKVNDSDIYLISDARFLNELEWIKSVNSYSILVVRAECQYGEDSDYILKNIKKYDNFTLTDKTMHSSEKEFLEWNGYDETIINFIDHNITTKQNMDIFINHINNFTIPSIKKKFSLPEYGDNRVLSG
jgi:hypothetical protein